MSASRGVSQQQARKDVRRVLEYKDALEPIIQELRASTHWADAARGSFERDLTETLTPTIEWEKGDAIQAPTENRKIL